MPEITPTRSYTGTPELKEQQVAETWSSKIETKIGSYSCFFLIFVL